MEHAPPQTAVEMLKRIGFNFTRANMPRIIRTLARDKGWNLADIQFLSTSKFFGHMVHNLLLRNRGEHATSNANIFNFIGSTLHDYEPLLENDCRPYRGSAEQNRQADIALYGSGISDAMLNGAATHFPGEIVTPTEVRHTPICIIGTGAAGIMVASTLKQAGFQSVVLYEKTGRRNGIWEQANVHSRSRNNPRRIEFMSRALEAAPGDGASVKNFLDGLARDYLADTNFEKREVVAVRPGNLKHQVLYLTPTATDPKATSSAEFPIVINCMGLGDPLPVSDPERMTTTADSSKDTGPRWQQTLTREQVQDQKFLFIGLGNSTAEMIRQIHEHQDKYGSGLNTDYHILTHYPKDAVFNPSDYVSVGNKTYRVFRDLSKPNLVDFHGDLSQFRSDYFRALSDGKIISDVKVWKKEDDRIAYTTKAKARSTVGFTKMFTLIGYRHSADTMRAMGCTYDDDNNCAEYDYDGEMIDNSYTNEPILRLHRGYFGMGAILNAPHNPNAIVIPGMVFRIPDLIFSVIMRAAEVARLKASKKA